MVLRSVLRLKPLLRECLTRCRHCRIFFLTDPRNRGRKDLGCPFGCSLAYRKQQSTRRSVAYYQDPIGKAKKRDINARRNDRDPVAPSSPLTPPSIVPWPLPLLEYLCIVVGLIEGRSIGLTEVLAMLRRTVRQHRMVRTRRLDHSVAWLNEQPP